MQQGQENTNSASSSWQVMNKSDSASDPGDDASSGKSGSAVASVTSVTTQSQDSTNSSSANVLQTGSSNPWSSLNPKLSSIDSSPWRSSSSPAPSGIGSTGWALNSGLSLSSTAQGHNNGLQPGSNLIGSNSAFPSIGPGSSSSSWSTSLTGNNLASTSSLPPSMSTGLQSNNPSSQWQGSSVLGNIGDFSKTLESSWSNPASSVLGSGKDLGGTNSDQRMWGFSSDKTSDNNQWETQKSQWGNNTMAARGDHTTSNTDMSFAEATLKGLKVLPTANTSPAVPNSRQEEILRAIENHEGWGSRPIRQDTSWDVDTSPKSHRKFSTNDNAGSSNVWDNSNGTAIWEAFRENQSSSLAGGSANGNSWNTEKDPASWGAPNKTPQDFNNWNVGGAAGPKSFETWGAAGGAGDASNKMWGQKTEIGSWGDPGSVQQPIRISSWNDDGDAGGWQDQRRPLSGMVPPSPVIGGAAGIPGLQGIAGMNMGAVGADTSTPWNDGQKQSWNPVNTSASGRTNTDEPWNKPPPQSGWGDPAQDGVEIDNGTGLWGTSATKQMPSQVKAAGWNDASAQARWNVAVGAKPKVPAGWDEASWALAQRAKQVPQKYVGSSNPPMQMRAKLIQHLMDLGYRKEEAQYALITNDMNLEMALNDLKAGNVNMTRKDIDMDVFQVNGPQSRMPYLPKGGLGGDDMSDIRPDQVPTFNTLQNTPFPNAQMTNQPFMQSNTSLPPSSLNPNSSSINSSLQQKLMAKMQQPQAPPSAVLSQRGSLPTVGSNTNSQAPQQPQQILAQLRQAVNNGFISPQLLNYQLPHNILLLLQQLLQHQTALQTLMSKQQQMAQQARITGNRSNPQLEHMNGLISNINQQIVNLQKQLQQAQNNLFSTQKPPVMSQTPTSGITSQSGVNMVDSLDALSSDLANVAIQNQSRLTTQWKSVPDATNNTTTDGRGLPSTPTTSKPSDENFENKAPGNKGIFQSSSSSNLNLIPGGLGMTGDKTWSTNMSTTGSNWFLSADSTGVNTQADFKAQTSTSSSASLLSGLGLQSGLADVIPEFVPGKPWQGLAKNVEDDPHVTPGSIQFQRSLSVNRVHDDSLNNLDSHKLNSSWGTILKNDNNLSQLGNRPPPGMAATKGLQQQWQSGSFNRQTSWTQSSNSAFTKVAGSGWNDSNSGISSWILLKNLTVDPNTIRALCAQHGTLNNFYSMAQGQLALVQYSSREIAFGAQLRLNNFQMGSSIITAEFVNEADAQRAVTMMPPPQHRVMPPMNVSLWSQAPPSTSFQNTGVRSGDPWSSSVPTAQLNSKIGSGGENPWGLWDRSDHNSNPLSNILGGESM